MRKNAINDIQNLIDLEAMESRWFKPADFTGNVLILKDANMKHHSVFGDFFLLTCVLEGSGEQVEISTGATQPFAVVKAWIELGKPAMRFSFRIDGQKVIMGKPIDMPHSSEMFTEDEQAT